MRLTRRGAFGLGLTAAGAAALAASHAAAKPALEGRGLVPVEVWATRLPGFEVRDRERRRFGALDFLGGVELRSAEGAFGGLSALRLGADGRRLLAVTDAGAWLSARLVTDEAEAPVGFAEAVMATLRGPDGRPLRATGHADTESLSGAEGVVHVGVERRHAVLRYDLDQGGLLARGTFLPVPEGMRGLPANKGLECLGVAPRGHPLAGSLVGIAEEAPRGGATTRGFILTGPRRGEFAVARSDDFDATDLDFLPEGDLLLLERRFSLFRGVAMRIRRFPAGALAPGAVLDGPTLIEADGAYDIDNMEGLAVSRAADGRALLTLISDDNFSFLQRTILLRFALAEAP